MVDQKVLAAINLHAVLRNMEDLCRVDQRAKTAIAGENIRIRFSVPSIDSGLLEFKDGECRAYRNIKACDMNLHFSSPEHFNLMIEGKKNPLPTKGFSHVGFLKNKFTELADLLTLYLRPSEEMLKGDKDFRDKSTLLTAYTAFFALSEIANYDRMGIVNAKRIEDGVISIEIKDTAAIYIIVKDGHLTTVKGKYDSPSAIMLFEDIDIAAGILGGTLDSYACIGAGKLRLSGRIPMLDNLNKILSIVAAYLS